MHTHFQRQIVDRAPLEEEADGLVVAMAATLVAEPLDPADHVGAMLRLHRTGFRAGDVSRLADRAIEKAREFREFFGLDSLGEALGAIGLVLTWASIVALACMFDPGEAAAQTISPTSPIDEARASVAVAAAALVSAVLVAFAACVAWAIAAAARLRKSPAGNDANARGDAQTNLREPDADADYENVMTRRKAAFDEGRGASRYDDILADALRRRQ